MGGQVPHSYYLRKNPPIAKDYMEMLNISAGVGGKKKLKFEVDVPYSAIRYLNVMHAILFEINIVSISNYRTNSLRVHQMGIYVRRWRHRLPHL